LLLSAGPSSNVASAAEEARVEVAADQTTTVVGSFASLSDLLSRLCKQADAELRAYSAPDREVTVNIEQRPFSETIERLLAHENYLLGVRGGRETGSEIRVAWVRVTGSKGTPAKPVPGAEPASAAGKQSADPRRAQEVVADRLLADDAQVAMFLSAEPTALAQSLRQYPQIGDVLRKLRARQQHPAVVEKIDAVLAELARLPVADGD